MSAADACTHEKHEAMKADAAKWAAETYPIAPEPLGGLEWVNCKACESTLVRPVAREVRS